MTVREAIKSLEKAGFEKLNQVGSHLKFGRGTDRITIVYHSKDSEELHKKTLKQVKLLIDGN